MRLSACTLLIEDYLAFICATRSSTNKAVYALCGREALKNQTGYSLRQITRCYHQLRLRGWKILQRRQDEDGRHQTNIFIPNGRAWRLIKEKIARLTKWKPAKAFKKLRLSETRRPSPAHIATHECIITSASKDMERFFPKKMPG